METADPVAAAADTVAGAGSDAEAADTAPPAGPAFKKRGRTAGAAALEAGAARGGGRSEHSQAERSAQAAAKQDARALAASDGFEVTAPLQSARPGRSPWRRRCLDPRFAPAEPSCRKVRTAAQANVLHFLGSPSSARQTKASCQACKALRLSKLWFLVGLMCWADH